MVQVIEGKDRARHADLFEKLFRARYETFVVNRRWSLPARNGLEIDQYDTDQAVYFIDIDKTGHLQGALRLTPTVTASLTADYYPHLSDGVVPLRDPLIYEGTRYMACSREKTPGNNRRVKARIISAATEWAWNVGIGHVQTIIDAPLLRSFKKVNSQTFALGSAHPYGGGKGAPGGGTCMAIRLPVTERAVREVKAYGGLETSMLPESCFNELTQPQLRNVA
ncbi:MAG: acyl-homoserine-lactone synthase [Methyloceanibacter sp.]|nr:acyl-homoserine-lactone synthase [Methyloceanibacter sp.]